jgi:hypothetical protein
MRRPTSKTGEKKFSLRLNPAKEQTASDDEVLATPTFAVYYVSLHHLWTIQKPHVVCVPVAYTGHDRPWIIVNPLI